LALLGRCHRSLFP